MRIAQSEKTSSSGLSSTNRPSKWQRQIKHVRLLYMEQSRRWSEWEYGHVQMRQGILRYINKANITTLLVLSSDTGHHIDFSVTKIEL